MTLLWFKALHLIFMVAWFAGLFYLPRLFVYHQNTKKPEQRTLFLTMERRLLFAIMLPAMLGTLFFGLAMLWMAPVYVHQAWMHAKLGLVFLLVIYHLQCIAYYRSLRQGTCRRGQVFFRWFNEIPSLLLVGTILLVVLKPTP